MGDYKDRDKSKVDKGNGQPGAQYTVVDWRDCRQSKVTNGGNRQQNLPSKMFIIFFIGFFSIQHKIHTRLAIQRSPSASCDP